MIKTRSAGYSILIRLEIPTTPGMLGKVATAIGKAEEDTPAGFLYGHGRSGW